MSAAAGERRIVSVLLADIVDSTAIGEQLGPERSKFLFDEVTRLLAAEVKRFGGTVAQLTGDGLYALFGVPHAHEDDAQRAVRAGLAMQAALDGYATDVAEAYNVSLAVRVGVNTGAVVLLPDEAPPEERYNALGDTVNTAARLQSHAGAGRVAIGPATARQVEAVFELESIGALELKGKGKPVEAHRVARERERADGDRRISPLVGREVELAVLDDVFAGLAGGSGAIVAVTGEAGIGKSRLVYEMRTRWQDRVHCVGAQGISYAEDVPTTRCASCCAASSGSVWAIAKRAFGSSSRRSSRRRSAKRPRRDIRFSRFSSDWLSKKRCGSASIRWRGTPSSGRRTRPCSSSRVRGRATSRSHSFSRICISQTSRRSISSRSSCCSPMRRPSSYCSSIATTRTCRPGGSAKQPGDAFATDSANCSSTHSRRPTPRG